MYSVEFSRRAEFQLYKLSGLVQKRIINSLERIRIRPHHFIKRKQGTPYYILRVGEYRIILDIRREKLLILVIELGHRKKIYK
jgi:mRNA interferase RelE/StbE